MRTALALTAHTALALALAVPAAAAVHTVDDSGGADFATIGEAIAAAAGGDTIMVHAGTYAGVQNRGLSLDYKNLVIYADDGHVMTTIDCEDQDRAFLLNTGQDTTTVIRGFSILNGNATALPITSGGAVYMHPGSDAVIKDCAFGGNTATDGGAIAIGDGNTAQVRDCSFTDNSATVFGGAINCNYDDSVIRGCSFSGNAAPDGGAVRLYYSSTAIIGCVFASGNSATSYGGAIWHGQCPSSARIEGCEFTANGAAQGGGIFCFYSSPAITDCDFVFNDAVSEGGGLRVTGEVPLTVTGCSFVGNTAHHGGGAHVSDAALTMTGCSFTSNEAGYWAGGLYLSADSVSVSTCDFTENYAAAGSGAVRAYDLAVGRGFDSCTFSGNVTDGDGGALSLVDCAGLAEDCMFAGNTAHGDGGGLCASGGAAPEIRNCTFSGNGTPAGDGGAIYDATGGATIDATIVAFSTGGAGIAATGVGSDIAHCCVFSNAGGDSLPGNHHENMFLNPLFCDAANDDYTLCADSSCLPLNNIWMTLIGAFGQGCPECGSAVERASWGRIKALYR